MKTVAEERRWPVAAWIVGAVAAPELALFAVLAKVHCGMFGWAWPLAILVPAALVIGTYVGAALVISLACRLVKGNGDPLRHLAAWALTYPATITAFALIILGHLVFPLGSPLPGPAQLVWFALLLAVLLWKLLLYFIYLRVVGGLGFKQMIVASAVLFVVVILYEVAMVSLGMGQVPFI